MIYRTALLIAAATLIGSSHAQAADQWVFVLASVENGNETRTAVRIAPSYERCMAEGHMLMSDPRLAPGLVKAGVLKMECRLNCKLLDEDTAQECEKVESATGID